MEKVQNKLSDCDNVTVIVNGSHMVNWSYWAFGNPVFKNFEAQLVSVTNHVEAISTEMDNFFKTIHLPELDRHTLIEFASKCRGLPFVAERNSTGTITEAAYDAAKKQQHDQCVEAGKESHRKFCEGKTKQEISDHYSAMGKESYRKFSEDKTKKEIYNHFSALGKLSWAKRTAGMTQQDISDMQGSWYEILSPEEKKGCVKRMTDGKQEATRKASGSSMERAVYIHPNCGTCIFNWDNFGSNTSRAKEAREGKVKLGCPTCAKEGHTNTLTCMSLEKFKEHHNKGWVECPSCSAIRHAINKSGLYTCGNEICKKFGKSKRWHPTAVHTEELGTPVEGLCKVCQFHVDALADTSIFRGGNIVFLAPDENVHDLRLQFSEHGIQNDVFGVREAKGLEFDACCLIGFFSFVEERGSSEQWTNVLRWLSSSSSLTKNSSTGEKVAGVMLSDCDYRLSAPNVSDEAMMLYTALTRARNHLYLIEVETKSCKGKKQKVVSLADFAIRRFVDLGLAESVKFIDEGHVEMTSAQHKARGVLYVTQALNLSRNHAPIGDVKDKFIEAKKRFGPDKGNDKDLFDKCEKHLRALLQKHDIMNYSKQKFLCGGDYNLEGCFSEVLHFEQKASQFFSQFLCDSFLVEDVHDVRCLVEEIFAGTPYEAHFKEVCKTIRTLEQAV
ncbi:hypothetical protein ACHAXR_004716 [Thalassiosira sp. AJA248-18]